MELGAKSGVGVLCALLALGCGDGTSGWILTENAGTGAAGTGGIPGVDAGSDVVFEVGVPPDPSPRDPEEFAGVCSPELFVENRTDDGSWWVFRDAFPDFPEYMVTTTKRVCSLLYKRREEVPRTRHLTVVIEDFQGAGWMQDSGDQAMIHLSSSYIRNLDANGESVRAEIGGVLHYLVAIDYGYHDENPRELGWLIEGIGEWVRHQAGQGSIDRPRPGGHWTDGLSTTGFFLDWLTVQHPDAVYLLNQSLSANDGYRWSDRVFEYITGQSLPTLWERYQASF